MTEIVIGGDMEDIPEGTYPATVKSIETKTSVKFLTEQNPKGEFRAWDFTLENGSVVGGASSMNTGSMSKGGRWIAAILGRKPEKGEKVNVIGKPCVVQVIENADGWPKVDAVLPPMKTNNAPSPAPHVEEPSAVPAALPEMP
jgi:hypothetical protein